MTHQWRKESKGSWNSFILSQTLQNLESRPHEGSLDKNRVPGQIPNKTKIISDCNFEMEKNQNIQQLWGCTEATLKVGTIIYTLAIRCVVGGMLVTIQLSCVWQFGGHRNLPNSIWHLYFKSLFGMGHATLGHALSKAVFLLQLTMRINILSVNKTHVKLVRIYIQGDYQGCVGNHYKPL